MGNGVFILQQEGERGFVGLEADLDCAIAEVRVEQHLDRPARFAVRFQEDFESDDPQVINASALRGAKQLAIVVPRRGAEAGGELGALSPGGEDFVCLIRGQVENSQAELSPAGTGSSFEVRGNDLRTQLDRVYDSWTYEQPSQAIFDDLLGKKLGVRSVDIDASPVGFGESKPYRFVGTHLEGMRRLSRITNQSVWFRYELGGAPGAYTVEVDAFAKVSPPRNAKAEQELNLADLADEQGYAAVLRIMGNDEICENVINFRHRTDTESYGSTSAYAVDYATGEPVAIEGTRSSQDALNPGDEVASAGGGSSEALSASAKTIARSCRIVRNGDADLVGSLSQSMANDAAWYVKASALTTAHMLGTVLQPHDLVRVLGGGCSIDGVFQVEHVTHVINAASHWMELELRSNAASSSRAEEVLGHG